MIINILDYCEKIEAENKKYIRYKGEWLKKLSGLDKSHNNGHAFEGDFVNIPTEKYRNIPRFELKDGLYFDLDTGGSRKNQHYNGSLFKVENDELTLIKHVKCMDQGYAIDFFEDIENYFNKHETLTEKHLREIKEDLSKDEIINLIDKLNKLIK